MSNVQIPKIAVLMAAYNGMNWIEEQIASILNQEHVVVHVFISVDLSSDSTYDWCKQLESENQNVSVLKYGERFGGAAKNFYRLIQDVDFSGFDYMVFADQDDIWDLDKLSHGIKKMQLANADAYSASVIAFWEDGREKLIDKSQPQKEFDYLLEAAGPGCTYIFTKKAANVIKKYLNEFPKLNSFILHDWLAYAILRHNNYVWIIDSEPKMYYRQHDSNQVGANSSFAGMIYRVKLIFSGQVFESIALLVNTFGIFSIELSSRIGLLRLALKARQLRRCRVDQMLAFIAICYLAIKRPKVILSQPYSRVNRGD